MTVSVGLVLWCDARLAGLRTCPRWLESGQSEPLAARWLAAERGWREACGLDYCPEHAEQAADVGLAIMEDRDVILTASGAEWEGR